jgi:hypothetical protein
MYYVPGLGYELDRSAVHKGPYQSLQMVLDKDWKLQSWEFFW